MQPFDANKELESPEGLLDSILQQRLETLSRCVAEKARNIEKGGINLHIHTNESFSIFRSPSEAVWQAYLQGIEYFGICDHYSTSGHNELRSACGIAGLKAIFGMEIKTIDKDALKRGVCVNDPHNPGRVYLIAKGITRQLKKSGRADRILRSMRNAIRKRNQAISANLDQYTKEKGYDIGFSYPDALSLTPHGNVTERHVIQAFCEKIKVLTENSAEQKTIFEDLVNTEIENRVFDDPWELQELVRTRLIRSGKPCYAQEDRRAFSSEKNVIGIFLEYGAVPTYSVMANPITSEEEDIERLLRKVKKKGLYAFDLLEFRTELKRARQVIETAGQYGFPVFIGTEHNTKKMMPMNGEIGKSPEFYAYLRKSADFVIGHQILSQLCDFGYVGKDGKTQFGDLKQGFRFFADVGKSPPGDDEIAELEMKDLRERKRYFNL